MSDPQPNPSDGELDIQHNQPEPSKPVTESSSPVNQTPVNQPVESQIPRPRPKTPEDWQKIAYGTPDPNQPVQQNTPQLPPIQPARSLPINEDGSVPQVYTDPVQEAEVEKESRRGGLTGAATKKLVILAIGMVVVIVGIFIFINSVGNLSYANYSFTNGQFTYSVKFPENATKFSTGSYDGYAIQNSSANTKTVVTAFVSPVQNDCGDQYINLKTVFKINLQGKSYSVCTSKQEAILLAYFKYDGTWQFIDVYSQNATTPINLKEAKKIMSSVKVNPY